METNDKIIKKKKRNLISIKLIIALVTLIILLLIIISTVIYSAYQDKQRDKLTTNITQSSNEIIISANNAGNLITAIKLTDSDRNSYISQLNNIIKTLKTDEISKYNNQNLYMQEQNNIALATYFKDEYILARNLSPLLKILNTYSTTSLPSLSSIYSVEAITRSVLDSNELKEMENIYNNSTYIQQQLLNYTTPIQIKNFLNTQLSAAQALASIKKINS